MVAAADRYRLFLISHNTDWLMLRSFMRAIAKGPIFTFSTRTDRKRASLFHFYTHRLHFISPLVYI